MSATALSVAGAAPDSQAARDIGWFGKIPATGDFVSRRVPASFMQPWDTWLQNGMAHARQTLGEHWDEVYLTFPVWRFLLPAGTAGSQHWAGVLMPSVDRVGRHFPLTLVTALHQSLTDISLPDLETALYPLEQAGLAALEGETHEAFDLRLRNLPVTPPTPRAASVLDALQDPQALGQWPLARGLATTLASEAGHRVLALLGERTLWWLPGSDQLAGTIRLSPWPMPDTEFATLICHD